MCSRVLLVAVRSYLTSFPSYKFLDYDTSHQPGALFLREQGCEGLWSFFEAKGGPGAENVWETLMYIFYLNINQLDALNFIICLFQASTCFEHMFSSSGEQNCIIQSLVSSHL